MTVLIYPVDHWFSYFLIDELLNEGHEVFGLPAGYKVVCHKDKVQSEQVEKVLLHFGRNANFSLQEDYPKQPIEHRIFVEKKLDDLEDNGVFITDQIDEHQQTKMKRISVNFEELTQLDDDTTESLTPNENSHQKSGPHTAKKAARWIVKHGLTDYYSEWVYLHGGDPKSSVYFLS